jgi:hypothetical protein
LLEEQEVKNMSIKRTNGKKHPMRQGDHKKPGRGQAPPLLYTSLGRRSTPV